MNRTLVILKPDAVERRMMGEIVARFERRGLTIRAAALMSIDRELASTHYDEHKERPFFRDLVEFITRSPVFAMVIEGPEDTWRIVRDMMGPTNPALAAPGTIRGDLGTDMGENLIHGSDSAESAVREIALFFPDLGT